MGKIDTHRWRELSPYLDEALALQESERAAWLESVGERNPELGALLETLLREHFSLARERFLEVSPPPPGADVPHRGQAIGSYTLLSPIGYGGMGSVWLAERSDGRFQRRVAIKFLSFALFGHAGEQRFRREGRFLARLSHPHIAELLDAGVTAAGQPYLVLEHVEGEPIDEYCARNVLDLAARVRLFLNVLSAVAHAHASLIVHRDLKPSNVMVTPTGQVKLLDFGIAKLLGDETRPVDLSLLTRDAGSALTPLFAAPEQLTGGPIATATDVYSAGVLLYLLLTGRHPVGAGPHSPAQLVKAITEAETPRPSYAVATAPSAKEPADHRIREPYMPPEKLRRQLRGDLDNIVLKALKKNPLERYHSASAFADDLARYLRHEPIHARPDTLPYRTSKFLRRRWLPVAAAIAVLVSLSVGLYAVNRQRYVAEQRFAELSRLSSKIFDLDRTIRDLPGSSAAREQLVAAALQYLDGLAADSRGDLDLSQKIAEGYLQVARMQGVPTDLNLGEPEKARVSLTRADALIERVLALRPANRKALLCSALVDEDLMILAQTEHRDRDAKAYGRRSAQRIDALLRLGNLGDPDRAEVIAAFGNIALAYLNMHSYAEAVPFARRMVDLGRPIASRPYQVAQGLSLLASALRYEGDLDGALQAIREARAIAARATYINETHHVLEEYGILLRQGLILDADDDISLGRPDEAIEPLQKAFDMNRDLARKDPRDATSRSRMATSGDYLGNILRQRDPDAAVAVYDQSLAAVRQVPRNPGALRSEARLLADSSYALRLLHRASDAEERIQSALVLLKQSNDLPAARVTLGSEPYVVLRAQGDDIAAEGNLSGAVELYESLLARVAASNPLPLDDLGDATKLSGLYRALALLYRGIGSEDKANETQARRSDLWRHWNEKLPNNEFVNRQLEDTALR